MAPNSISSKPAAEYIGMSESWLRKTRMEGNAAGPPFCKLGSKAVRYLTADLDAWLSAQRRVIREIE